jgi:RNA polymerase sigma factor (sigma-70 family)
MGDFSKKNEEIMPVPEPEMILNLQSDNQEWFSKLYDRFSPALFGLILKWINDRMIAETLLKEVFVKAWYSRKMYDPGKAIPFTWLYRIARNSCVDFLRSKEL